MEIRDYIKKLKEQKDIHKKPPLLSPQNTTQDTSFGIAKKKKVKFQEKFENDKRCVTEVSYA